MGIFYVQKFGSLFYILGEKVFVDQTIPRDSYVVSFDFGVLLRLLSKRLQYTATKGTTYEPLSKLLVSPLITPIVAPDINPKP